MAGVAAEIDLSKLDKMINKLETNLQRFVDKSKDAQTQVVDAFTKMGTNGVNKFVSQLSGAINQVMEIGKKGSAIKWDSQNLNRYIDQVNQLIKLVQQVGGAGFTLPTANLNKQFASISRLKDDLKVVNELLNKGEKTGVDSNGNAIYRQLTAAEQNYFVELKKNIQEQLKFQQQSIQERLASVKKALQEELKETQETEKKKTQARNQSYKGAIKYSDKANSLEQERKAIKNLEAARESLKKTDSDYSAKLEELNRRINAHRINVEAATKTEAQRNALTSSTRAEYARLLAEQDKLRQSYDKLKQSQATLGNTPETTAALQNIVNRYRDVYAEIQRYKQSANGQLDATERKFLADQASAFAENERRKTDIAQQEAQKRATISSAEAKKVIASASGAKNVNQQIAAIQQLKNARDKLDKTDKDYKKTLEELNKAIKKHQEEIDKVRGKTDSANNSHKRLMDTAGQLQRKLALVFSVSAIQGYISKLMQVRGEFEMQQRSLQVLLQDKDEANKLWDKTVALAVKSPFRVKQLVTYTRQLAAYRIETEKLHDTTRRLSDVSAGLGVDMQRIILAFGQVRAANFLRGTELRQFTEAGIPMLDELAKYFTELEGRAISAGDLFEMISKRMVYFSDVEEVFHRMTNAGGVFYKMQEEQSKTLSGLISNLHDSIDLMLNDIGKANDGVLKGSINTMRQFVDNWREVAYTLEKVVIAYSLYKIANAAFILGSKNATTTTLWWNNALKAKIGTTMADIQTMTLQEASLYGVSKGQYAAGKATMFFQGAIRGVGLALKMAAPFLLAFMAIEIVRYFTAASRAAAELQRELEEIYQSDYTNFKKQSDTLKDLVERLKNVTKGSQEHKDIISRLNSSYGEYLGNLNEETATYENLAASIDKTIMALSQKAKAQTLEKAIAKSFEKTNKEIMSLQEDITNGMERLVRESGGAMLVPQEQEINDFFNLFEKRTKEAGELLDRSDINKILSEYYGENVMITSDIDFSHFVSLGEQILEQKQQEEKVQRQINNLYGEGIYSTQKAREEFQKLEEDKAKALQNEKTRIGRQKIENQFEMARIDLQVKYEGLDKNIADYRKSLAKGISATVEDINRQIIESIPELGEDVADKIFIDQATAATGLESIAESTAQAYKGQLELIKQQNALKDAGTVYDQKLLANAERMAKGYYKRLEIMGRLDLLKKSSNDSDSKELQLLNRQLSAIKDASSAFESLSDIYGGEEAKKKVASSFANLFKELNISEITDDMDFDALGVVRVLNQLPNIAGERGAQAIEKLKAEFNSEIDVDLRIGRVKTIEEQISELFSGYELSIELDKMNIPEDLAQSLFNIDATSLPALKEQVKSFEDELIALGDKGVDVWNKSQKKIEEVEKKTQLERLKKYVKYLVQAQGERVKIKMDEIRQLNEIESLNFTETQKAMARMAIQQESKQKMDKLEWEDFKDSGMYIQLFEGLEYASTSALNKMRERLMMLKDQLSGLDADDLRHLYNQIEKLDEQLAKRSPYKTAITGINEYIQALKDSKRIELELDKETTITRGLKRDESSLSTQLAIEQSKYRQMVANFNVSSKDVSEQYKKVQTLESQLALAKAQLLAQGKLTKELEKQLDEAKHTRKTFEGSLSDIGSDITEAANALPNIANDLENVFGTMSDGTKDAIDSISTIAGGVGDAISGFASGNYIQAISGVAKAIGGIFAIGDKKKERQIQREIKFVEDLERAYQKLEKAIDNAYTFDTLKGSYDAAQKNIDAQIASYNKMIAAEEDKKKTDKDRIKEWQQAIEDLSEERKELLKSQVEELGGGYDYSAMTEEFVNAWLDAFKETGNGLSGLEDNFEDFWQNIAMKQAVMGGASKIMQPFLDAVNKALENDFKLDDSEMANIDQLSAKAKEDMNAFLEQWYNKWGDFMTQGEQSELSGLQRGIQGVTEETAQIIEAYMASVRFYVADSNSKLTMIANQIVGSDETTNPMLSELRSQTELIRSIRDMFGSVIKQGHSTFGGAFLKVSL